MWALSIVTQVLASRLAIRFRLKNQSWWPIRFSALCTGKSVQVACTGIDHGSPIWIGIFRFVNCGLGCSRSVVALTLLDALLAPG